MRSDDPLLLLSVQKPKLLRAAAPCTIYSDLTSASLAEPCSRQVAWIQLRVPEFCYNTRTSGMLTALLTLLRIADPWLINRDNEECGMFYAAELMNNPMHNLDHIWDTDRLRRPKLSTVEAFHFRPWALRT